MFRAPAAAPASAVQLCRQTIEYANQRDEADGAGGQQQAQFQQHPGNVFAQQPGQPKNDDAYQHLQQLQEQLLQQPQFQQLRQQPLFGGGGGGFGGGGGRKGGRKGGQQPDRRAAQDQRRQQAQDQQRQQAQDQRRRILLSVQEAEDTARRSFEALQADLEAWETEARELEQLGARLGDALHRAKLNREAQEKQERAKEEKELEDRLRELRASGGGGGGGGGGGAGASAGEFDFGNYRGSAAAAPPPAPAPAHDENCQICMERKRDICLVPCGHSIICGVCAEQVQECPWCHAAIQQRVRMYQ